MTPAIRWHCVPCLSGGGALFLLGAYGLHVRHKSYVKSGLQLCKSTIAGTASVNGSAICVAKSALSIAEPSSVSSSIERGSGLEEPMNSCPRSAAKVLAWKGRRSRAAAP